MEEIRIRFLNHVHDFELSVEECHGLTEQYFLHFVLHCKEFIPLF